MVGKSFLSVSLQHMFLSLSQGTVPPLVFTTFLRTFLATARKTAALTLGPAFQVLDLPQSIATKRIQYVHIEYHSV